MNRNFISSQRTLNYERAQHLVDDIGYVKFIKNYVGYFQNVLNPVDISIRIKEISYGSWSVLDV